MNEVYIKKYWKDEDVLFYIHFKDGYAIEQIEIKGTSKIYLTTETPIQGESMLYDQKLDELELEKNDFITNDEFNIIWKNRGS